jgi:hypothetical protein
MLIVEGLTWVGEPTTWARLKDTAIPIRRWARAGVICDAIKSLDPGFATAARSLYGAFMKTLALSLVLAVTAFAQADILTKSYDNTRSGQTTSENILTPESIAARGVHLVTTIPVIGDRIGEEAQPLISKGVLVLPSEANIIRGVRPSDGVGIWQTPALCVPVNSVQGANGKPNNDLWHTNDHFGMMATGVIDPDTNLLYQPASCSNDRSGLQASVTQHMFVVNVLSGDLVADTLFTGKANGVDYASAPRKQRSAATLWKVNGVKFIMGLSGSFAETGDNASGFLWAFDTFDNRFKAMLPTLAGGWMSGQGLSIDADGMIYFGLGNGPFNGTTSFGEAVLQVRFTPPTAASAARFQVLHAWAPFSDAGRTCANPQLTQPTARLANKIAGDSAPSNIPGGSMPMATGCNKEWGDQDAHLFGKLLPDVHKYFSGGKDGITYLTDTRNFPSTQPADFRNPKANCAKVGMNQPGSDLGMDSCPTRLADLNRFPGNTTRHIHSTPATYIAPDGSHYELVMGENDPLQANRINLDGTMSYVARGAETASEQSPVDPANQKFGGMPGGFCTVSSNKGTDAIAWCSVPHGNANRPEANRMTTTGRLIAYDLTKMGDGKIPTIWTSPDFSYSKFMAPIVWNGRVYLPNSDGGVNVYGLKR